MGNRPIIDFLVQCGALTDFFTACVLGGADQVRAELEANPARPRDRGIHDLPPLYFAAIDGRLELAELLLAEGAEVNERAEAAAPIHGAVMGGSSDLVDWLLERRADPDAPDYEGRNARALAFAMNREDLAGLF